MPPKQCHTENVACLVGNCLLSILGQCGNTISWQDSFTIIKPLASEFKNPQTRFCGVLFKRKKMSIIFDGLISSDYFGIILNETNI